MKLIKEKNQVYFLDDQENKLAYVTFPLVAENTVEINHTFVDDSLRGQGIASQLMTAAYEVIVDQGYHLKLSCKYAIGWFEKHPEKIIP